MDKYLCFNCFIPLEYNRAFGWILYVEGSRRCVYLNYCPNCGVRLNKSPMNIQDALDRLGNTVDQIENFIGFSKLPLGCESKVEGLVDQLRATRDEIKDIYFELGGDDVWELGSYD